MGGRHAGWLAMFGLAVVLAAIGAGRASRRPGRRWVAPAWSSQAVPLDPIQQFVAACLRADRPAVQRLLAADPGLAERVRNVSRVPEPLHLAVALGRPEAVALLASLGFPINGDWRGWGSPLHVAALSGRLDIVRLLVELGADPTAAPDDNDASAELIPHDRTPLGGARYFNQHEVVAYLTRRTSAGPHPPARLCPIGRTSVRQIGAQRRSRPRPAGGTRARGFVRRGGRPR